MCKSQFFLLIHFQFFLASFAFLFLSLSALFIFYPLSPFYPLEKFWPQPFKKPGNGTLTWPILPPILHPTRIGHVFSGIALPEFGRHSKWTTYGWSCPCCVSCLSKQSGDVKTDDVTSGSMSPDFNVGKIRLLTRKSWGQRPRMWALNTKNVLGKKPPKTVQVPIFFYFQKFSHNFVITERPEPHGRMFTRTRGSLAIFLFKAWIWTAILWFIESGWYRNRSIASLW